MTPIGSFIRLIRNAPRGQAIALFALMIAASVTEGVGILLLVPLLEVLDSGADHGEAARGLVDLIAATGLPMSMEGLLSAFVVLVVMRSAILFAREQHGTKFQLGLVDRMRRRCFAALLHVEWRWLVAESRSEHANLLLSDIGRIGIGLSAGINLMAMSVAILSYLAVAVVLSPAMTLLAVVSGGLVFRLLSSLRRQAMDLGYAQTRASRAMFKNVQESLSGIKLSKILGSERRHLDHFTETAAALRQQQIRFGRNTSKSKAFFQVAGALLLVLYLIVGARVLEMPTAQLLTLVLVFGRLVPMFMSFQQLYNQWIHAIPALLETEKLLESCEAHSEAEVDAVTGVDVGAGRANAGHPEPLPLNQAITLDDVAFSYPERDLPALRGLTVRIPARTTTVVAGASGAGKSTLADILMGLLVPGSGRMCVDGVEITGAARRRWRRSVVYVPQDAFLYHDTVRNNLLWSAPDASEDDLRRALERASAMFVFDLPQGLDTMVGDMGLRLSGGERQRVALARGLLRRPDLLILDEATSALDDVNAERVREAIRNLHGNLTVVVIGHRVPGRNEADQVIALDHGRQVAPETIGLAGTGQPDTSTVAEPGR